MGVSLCCGGGHTRSCDVLVFKYMQMLTALEITSLYSIEVIQNNSLALESLIKTLLGYLNEKDIKIETLR
jgi:hypothetical protein